MADEAAADDEELYLREKMTPLHKRMERAMGITPGREDSASPPGSKEAALSGAVVELENLKASIRKSPDFEPQYFMLNGSPVYLTNEENLRTAELMGIRAGGVSDDLREAMLNEFFQDWSGMNPPSKEIVSEIPQEVLQVELTQSAGRAAGKFGNDQSLSVSRGIFADELSHKADFARSTKMRAVSDRPIEYLQDEHRDEVSERPMEYLRDEHRDEPVVQNLDGSIYHMTKRRDSSIYDLQASIEKIAGMYGAVTGSMKNADRPSRVSFTKSDGGPLKVDEEPLETSGLGHSIALRESNSHNDQDHSTTKDDLLHTRNHTKDSFKAPNVRLEVPDLRLENAPATGECSPSRQGPPDTREFHAGWSPTRYTGTLFREDAQHWGSPLMFGGPRYAGLNEQVPYDDHMKFELEQRYGVHRDTLSNLKSLSASVGRDELKGQNEQLRSLNEELQSRHLEILVQNGQLDPSAAEILAKSMGITKPLGRARTVKFGAVAGLELRATGTGTMGFNTRGLGTRTSGLGKHATGTMEMAGRSMGAGTKSIGRQSRTGSFYPQTLTFIDDDYPDGRPHKQQGTVDISFSRDDTVMMERFFLPREDVNREVLKPDGHHGSSTQVRGTVRSMSPSRSFTMGPTRSAHSTRSLSPTRSAHPFKNMDGSDNSELKSDSPTKLLERAEFNEENTISIEPKSAMELRKAKSATTQTEKRELSTARAATNVMLSSAAMVSPKRKSTGLSRNLGSRMSIHPKSSLEKNSPFPFSPKHGPLSRNSLVEPLEESMSPSMLVLNKQAERRKILQEMKNSIIGIGDVDSNPNSAVVLAQHVHVYSNSHSPDEDESYMAKRHRVRQQEENHDKHDRANSKEQSHAAAKHKDPSNSKGETPSLFYGEAASEAENEREIPRPDELLEQQSTFLPSWVTPDIVAGNGKGVAAGAEDDESEIASGDETSDEEEDESDKGEEELHSMAESTPGGESDSIPDEDSASIRSVSHSNSPVSPMRFLPFLFMRDGDVRGPRRASVSGSQTSKRGSTRRSSTRRSSTALQSSERKPRSGGSTEGRRSIRGSIARSDDLEETSSIRRKSRKNSTGDVTRKSITGSEITAGAKSTSGTSPKNTTSNKSKSGKVPKSGKRVTMTGGNRPPAADLFGGFLEQGRRASMVNRNSTKSPKPVPPRDKQHENGDGNEWSEGNAEGYNWKDGELNDHDWEAWNANESDVENGEHAQDGSRKQDRLKQKDAHADKDKDSHADKNKDSHADKNKDSQNDKNKDSHIDKHKHSPADSDASDILPDVPNDFGERTATFAKDTKFTEKKSKKALKSEKHDNKSDGKKEKRDKSKKLDDKARKSDKLDVKTKKSDKHDDNSEESDDKDDKHDTRPKASYPIRRRGEAAASSDKRHRKKSKSANDDKEQKSKGQHADASESENFFTAGDMNAMREYLFQLYVKQKEFESTLDEIQSDLGRKQYQIKTLEHHAGSVPDPVVKLLSSYIREMREQVAGIIDAIRVDTNKQTKEALLHAKSAGAASVKGAIETELFSRRDILERLGNQLLGEISSAEIRPMVAVMIDQEMRKFIKRDSTLEHLRKALQMNGSDTTPRNSADAPPTKRKSPGAREGTQPWDGTQPRGGTQPWDETHVQHQEEMTSAVSDLLNRRVADIDTQEKRLRERERRLDRREKTVDANEKWFQDQRDEIVKEKERAAREHRAAITIMREVQTESPAMQESGQDSSESHHTKTGKKKDEKKPTKKPTTGVDAVATVKETPTEPKPSSASPAKEQSVQEEKSPRKSTRPKPQPSAKPKPADDFLSSEGALPTEAPTDDFLLREPPETSAAAMDDFLFGDSGDGGVAGTEDFLFGGEPAKAAPKPKRKGKSSKTAEPLPQEDIFNAFFYSGQSDRFMDKLREKMIFKIESDVEKQVKIGIDSMQKTLPKQVQCEVESDLEERISTEVRRRVEQQLEQTRVPKQIQEKMQIQVEENVIERIEDRVDKIVEKAFESNFGKEFKMDFQQKTLESCHDRVHRKVDDARHEVKAEVQKLLQKELRKAARKQEKDKEETCSAVKDILESVEMLVEQRSDDEKKFVRACKTLFVQQNKMRQVLKTTFSTMWQRQNMLALKRKVGWKGETLAKGGMSSKNQSQPKGKARKESGTPQKSGSPQKGKTYGSPQKGKTYTAMNLPNQKGGGNEVRRALQAEFKRLKSTETAGTESSDPTLNSSVASLSSTTPTAPQFFFPEGPPMKRKKVNAKPDRPAERQAKENVFSPIPEENSFDFFGGTPPGSSPAPDAVSDPFDFLGRASPSTGSAGEFDFLSGPFGGASNGGGREFHSLTGHSGSGRGEFDSKNDAYWYATWDQPTIGDSEFDFRPDPPGSGPSVDPWDTKTPSSAADPWDTKSAADPFGGSAPATPEKVETPQRKPSPAPKPRAQPVLQVNPEPMPQLGKSSEGAKKGGQGVAVSLSAGKGSTTLPADVNVGVSIGTSAGASTGISFGSSSGVNFGASSVVNAGASSLGEPTGVGASVEANHDPASAMVMPEAAVVASMEPGMASSSIMPGTASTEAPIPSVSMLSSSTSPPIASTAMPITNSQTMPVLEETFASVGPNYFGELTRRLVEVQKRQELQRISENQKSIEDIARIQKFEDDFRNNFARLEANADSRIHSLEETMAELVNTNRKMQEMCSNMDNKISLVRAEMVSHIGEHLRKVDKRNLYLETELAKLAARFGTTKKLVQYENNIVFEDIRRNTAREIADLRQSFEKFQTEVRFDIDQNLRDFPRDSIFAKYGTRWTSQYYEAQDRESALRKYENLSERDGPAKLTTSEYQRGGRHDLDRGNLDAIADLVQKMEREAQLKQISLANVVTNADLEGDVNDDSNIVRSSLNILKNGGTIAKNGANVGSAMEIGSFEDSEGDEGRKDDVDANKHAAEDEPTKGGGNTNGNGYPGGVKAETSTDAEVDGEGGRTDFKTRGNDSGNSLLQYLPATEYLPTKEWLPTTATEWLNTALTDGLEDGKANLRKRLLRPDVRNSSERKKNQQGYRPQELYLPTFDNSPDRRPSYGGAELSSPENRKNVRGSLYCRRQLGYKGKSAQPTAAKKASSEAKAPSQERPGMSTNASDAGAPMNANDAPTDSRVSSNADAKVSSSVTMGRNEGRSSVIDMVKEGLSDIPKISATIRETLYGSQKATEV